MLRVAQVVAALDAVAALAADGTANDAARGERGEWKPQNRSVEDHVDREAGPDGMQWQESDYSKREPCT